MHAINLEVEKGLVAGRGDYRGLSSPRRWHQPQSTYAFFAASGILAFTLGFSNVVAVEDRTGSLWSQLLCWCIIFVLVDAWHYFKAGGDWRLLKPGGESNGRSEALAFIITLLSVIPTFARVLWAFPLLVPALTIYQQSMPSPNLSIDQAPEGRFLFIRPPKTTILRPLVIALVCCWALLPYQTKPLDIIAGVTWCSCMYFAFSHLQTARTRGIQIGVSPLDPLIEPTVILRIIALLSLGLVMQPSQPFQVHSMLLAASNCASQWIAIIVLINLEHLPVIATIGTVGLAAAEALKTQHSQGRTLLLIAVAMIALLQSSRAARDVQHSKNTFALVLVLLLTTISLRHLCTICVDPEAYALNGLFHESPHPVEILVKEADRKFARMVKRQSQHIAQATREYKRRYHMDPPPGFSQWFEFAKKSQSPIIDDYDTIMNALRPYWGLSARELRTRAQEMDESRTAFVSVRNKSVSITQNNLILGGFDLTVRRWLDNHLDIVPDIDFLINGFAEPRSIVPNDRLERLIRSCPPPISPNETSTHHELAWMDLGKKTSWQISTNSCPEDSTSRSDSYNPPHDTDPLPFIQNITHSKDWCSQPDADHTHAAFSSPYNLRITPNLIPIFSHGKPSTSQDIIYPSPDYLNTPNSPSEPTPYDPPWENKTNTLYWAGSDTGGYARGSNWHGFQRQRFVETVTNTTAPVTFLNSTKSSFWRPHRWTPYKSTLASLWGGGGGGDPINVHFTKIEMCDGAACAAERAALPLGPKDNASVALGHKFLFDVDGMGRTQRFYHLLGSNSCVLKQTMMTEWHDDWLVPWVHYVPVSLGMRELPELLRWLMDTGRGGEVARKIAQQGREWREKALREVDMEVAFLRLVLEYGRLYDLRRDEEGWCPWNRRKDGGGM